MVSYRFPLKKSQGKHRETLGVLAPHSATRLHPKLPRSKRVDKIIDFLTYQADKSMDVWDISPTYGIL